MKAAAILIGAGFVGKAHVDALRRLGIEIRGVVGSSAERSEEARAALGLPRAYASIEEAAADNTASVAHVCTPNYLHFEQSSALMRAGKHVLCEKPLATDTAESEILVKLARECKRAGGVAYNLRYYPLCQEAKALVASGAIGTPRLVHGSFLQDWLLHASDWNWRLGAETGRGIARRVGHWHALAGFRSCGSLGAKVDEVCADLGTTVPVRQRPRGRVETFKTRSTEEFDEVPITTDDYASVLLHFANDMRGAMTVSQVSAGRKARLWFEIDGTEGSLAWDSESPNELWIGRRDEANGLLIKDPALLSPEARGYAAYPGGHAEGYPDTFVQLFRDFYEYVEAGDFEAPQKFPNFLTGHQELTLCEAIAKSAQTRTWVEAPLE